MNSMNGFTGGAALLGHPLANYLNAAPPDSLAKTPPSENDKQLAGQIARWKLP
jgi:hypothetical protein